MNIKPGYYYNNSTRTFEIGSIILTPLTRIHSTDPAFEKIDARVFGLLIHEEKLLANLKERFSDVSEYVVTPEIVLGPEDLYPPAVELPEPISDLNPVVADEVIVLEKELIPTEPIIENVVIEPLVIEEPIGEELPITKKVKPKSKNEKIK